MTRTFSCPSCRRAAAKDGNPRFPFCSERCRLVDLGRWLGEEFRIPDEPDVSGGGIDRVPGGDDER